MVLDRVVSPAFQELGNLGPLVLILPIRNEENELLLLSPVVLLYPWVQVVVPALPALLANPTRQEVSDVSPLLRTSLMDQLHHKRVLLLGPWPLD